MDTGKFVGLLVFGLIGVLLVVAFTPMITNVTNATATFENEGYYNLTKIDENTESTVIWDAAHPTIFNIDGVDIDVSTTGRLTILGSDSICLRYNTANNTHQVQVFGSYNGTQGYKAANESANDTMTVTISGGVVSVAVSGETAKNFDLGDDAYLLTTEDATADYVAVMKITTEKAYLLKDSEVVICGISVANSQGGAIGVFGKGDMTNGIQFSTFFVGSNYTGDVTFTDTVTYSDTVNGYNDLYTLEKYTTTINYNEGSTSDATYSYFIVPSEVIAEKTVHASPTLASILNLLPMIIVVGLLLILIGEFLYTRYL